MSSGLLKLKISAKWRYYKVRKDFLYRKIYEHCYGQIPYDEDGRRYDIDHLDGNYANNHPANLDAKPIKKHYEKHYKNGDYGACYYISIRMKKTPKEISEIARQSCLKRVRDGTNPFVGPKINNDRVKNGTHPLTSEVNRKVALRRSKAGTLPAQIQSKDKTHHWFGDKNPAHKQIKNGTHHSVIEHTCPYCNKTGRGHTMFRWHFKNCKMVSQ